MQPIILIYKIQNLPQEMCVSIDITIMTASVLFTKRSLNFALDSIKFLTSSQELYIHKQTTMNSANISLCASFTLNPSVCMMTNCVALSRNEATTQLPTL